MKIVLGSSKSKAILLGSIYLVTTLNNIPALEALSLPSIFVGFFCVDVLFGYRRKQRLQSEQKRIIHLVLYLLLLSWTSYIWSVDKGVTLSRNYAYTILPVYFIFVCLANIDSGHLRIIDNYIIVSAALLLLYEFSTVGVSGIMLGRFAITEGVDQNATSATIFLLLLVLLKRIRLLRNEHKPKIIIIGIFLLHIWLFLLTGSRGGLLALAVTIVLTSTEGKRNGFIKGALLVFVVLLLGYFIAPYVLPENIYSRLFQTESYRETIYSTKNRVAIWNYCIHSLLPSMPLYGYGAGTPAYLAGPTFGFVYRSIHNTYLNMILEFGLLGLPAFLYLFFLMIKTAISQNKRLILSCIIGAVIIAFFLESYSRTYFWNLLSYSFVSLYSSSELKKS